jgi:hypothetical protein
VGLACVRRFLGAVWLSGCAARCGVAWTGCNCSVCQHQAVQRWLEHMSLSHLTRPSSWLTFHLVCDPVIKLQPTTAEHKHALRILLSGCDTTQHTRIYTAPTTGSSGVRSPGSPSSSGTRCGTLTNAVSDGMHSAELPLCKASGVGQGGRLGRVTPACEATGWLSAQVGFTQGA